MADPNRAARFRHAVLAATVAFVRPPVLPTSVREVGQSVAHRVLRYLDQRRAKMDPGLGS